jgi:hypothetical protein
LDRINNSLKKSAVLLLESHKSRAGAFFRRRRRHNARVGGAQNNMTRGAFRENKKVAHFHGMDTI